MKNLILVLVFLLPIIVCAQSNLIDVVHLKNGSIIKGVIVEQVPGGQVKVQTSDGSLFIFESADILKMNREEGPSSSGNGKKSKSDVLNGDKKERDEWGHTYAQNIELHDTRRTMGIGMLSSGSALAAGGGVMFILSADVSKSFTDRRLYTYIGTAASVLGVGLIIPGAIAFTSSKKYMRRANDMNKGNTSLAPSIIGTQRFSGAHIQGGTAMGLQISVRF